MYKVGNEQGFGKVKFINPLERFADDDDIDDDDDDNEAKGREKLTLVDWLRSKTPALATEVNTDQEANQFLEDNQVTLTMIMTLMLMLMLILMLMLNHPIVVTGQCAGDVSHTRL